MEQIKKSILELHRLEVSLRNPTGWALATKKDKLLLTIMVQIYLDIIYTELGFEIIEKCVNFIL